MPRKKPPSYRLHKPTGQAVVTIRGKDVYLGKHGTTESRQRYHRLLAEWESNGRELPPASVAPSVLTVADVMLRYLRWARERYRKADGSATKTIELIRLALRPLRQLYSRMPAREFGPIALQTLRNRLIAGDYSRAVIDADGKKVKRPLSRSTVNKHVARIKHVFKWAASQQLVPVEVYQALATVEGLRAGEMQVREGRKVRPVPVAHVEAIKPHVSR